MFCIVSTPISLPWWARSDWERLTPRGEPRHRDVVGVAADRRDNAGLVVGNRRPSRPLVAVNPQHGARCGYLRQAVTGLRTALCAGRIRAHEQARQGNGGVSDPPGFPPRSPRGRSGGSLTPPRATVHLSVKPVRVRTGKPPRDRARIHSPFRRAWRLESKRGINVISASKGGPMPLIKART